MALLLLLGCGEVVAGEEFSIGIGTGAVFEHGHAELAEEFREGLPVEVFQRMCRAGAEISEKCLSL